MSTEIPFSITETGTLYQLAFGIAVFGIKIEPAGTTFNQPATITLNWPDSLCDLCDPVVPVPGGDGIVDGSVSPLMPYGIQEYDLLIAKKSGIYNDRITGFCEDGSGNDNNGSGNYTSLHLGTFPWSCNMATNTFSVQVTSLSEFVVINLNDPTAITLSDFNAKQKGKTVIINWQTGTEIDNIGFNILRSESENGNYKKINKNSISAKGNATHGATYKFVDDKVKSGKTYYYKLEDVDRSGGKTLHGPKVVKVSLKKKGE